MSGLVIASGEKDPVKISAAVNQLAQGRSNATGTVTLTPSATTTTVTAITCSKTSYVFLSPQNAHAANDAATTFATAGDKQFVITHANNSRNDRTFGWVCLG